MTLGTFAPSTALFAAPSVRCENRADGGVLLSATEPLGEHPATLVDSLDAWARRDPAHVLVAERVGESWRRVGYGEAARVARAIGAGLLERGLGPDRPLMILSGNSVNHLLLTLGAMVAGVPVAPVSVAYSLLSADHSRIRDIAELIGPGAVHAEDETAFGGALSALGEVPRVSFDELAATTPGPELEEAHARVGGETVAKILFTSGSTGTPKGVLTTHEMLAANQQMMRQVWPFLAAERPLIVDWLPWSHTFGGSHNVGMMLANGGSLYVDGGRPAPGLFETSLANLREVPPTIYFNVPAGYAQLVPALENDPELAALFFSRLRLLFNAAAGFPTTLRDRLAAVAERTVGHPVPVTGSWGLTETAPAVTNAHFDFTDARSIGVPLPGADVLLAPVEDRYEIRVRGPMVTPGYFDRPDLTEAAFDEDGFYRTGDSVDFADPADLDLGLVFRGRIAEDFKLSTGTFVHVGVVRTSLLSVVPVLADAVIVGEHRDEVCALAWVNAAEARRILGRDPHPGDAAGVVVDEELSAHLARALEEQGQEAGSSSRVERMLVMAQPADLDAGEVTDKGYVNQRRVLQTRSHLAEMLYADPLPSGVVVRKAGPR